MQVIGYSERGIVNALFHEIKHSPEPESLLEKLLSRVRFPLADRLSLSVSDAEVLIEQSFSQFGSADALLVVRSAERAVSAFIEAKVGAKWSIEKEFQDFKDGTKTRVSSSNLFTQLYHKVRLVAGLRQGGIPGLQEGIGFPQSSKRKMRKIGSNPVVLRAVEKLAGYLDETYYVAMLPNRPEELQRLFENLSGWRPPDDFLDWDVRNYGYLSWSEVEEFCRENVLLDTLNVFEFNEGQIYIQDQSV